MYENVKIKKNVHVACTFSHVRVSLVKLDVSILHLSLVGMRIQTLGTQCNPPPQQPPLLYRCNSVRK